MSKFEKMSFLLLLPWLVFTNAADLFVLQQGKRKLLARRCSISCKVNKKVTGIMSFDTGDILQEQHRCASNARNTLGADFYTEQARMQKRDLLICHVIRIHGGRTSGGNLTSSRSSSSLPTQPTTGLKWMGMPLPQVLLCLLVIHKCGTDCLSRYTRSSGVPYSATTVAILGEVVKVPILACAIMIFEGKSSVKPILQHALTDAPYSLALPGLAYASQNILYFVALSHLSATSYQLLSQTKLLFTGFFMWFLLEERLTMRKVGALLLLLAGSILTQLSELMSKSTISGKSIDATGNVQPLLGGALTVLGAAMSALPNVYYEKVLKRKHENQWIRNVQLTFWITIFLLMFGLPSILATIASSESGLNSGLVSGISGWVYLVMLLQGFKCLLIPATLKYSNNIFYAYSKPAAILLTAVVTAVTTGQTPSAQFVIGGLLVVASLLIWG